MDWGALTLGSIKNVEFYVKNALNVNVKLELQVNNWMPAGIDDYLTIHWDNEGTVLTPTQEIPATVTLEVASDGGLIDFLVENEVTAFGFDITIFASSV